MKILHTADWHLGDRLGRIDRTDDLRRAVERVAALCEEHQVDLLLVAGDLFSELARPDSLRISIEYLQKTFHPFLLRGGTILAITGNHDNETFCQTLQFVMDLAAPSSTTLGAVHPPGRLYLATDPTLLRLLDKNEAAIQFFLLPYPTPRRYLREEEQQRFAGVEEKNVHLKKGLTRSLKQMLDHNEYDPNLPSVLAAHIHVQGVLLPNLFRMSEQESIIFLPGDLPENMDYIALGHIHQPQIISGQSHIRYSSSIERLDLGERNDQKGVVLLDIGPEGLESEPQFLPLPATPIYHVEISNPAEEIPRLPELYPDANYALANIEFTYTAGKDNLEAILNELEKVFPRWYVRNWIESSTLGPTFHVGEEKSNKSFKDTIREYLETELMNHPEEDRDAVMELAEDLFANVEDK